MHIATKTTADVRPKATETQIIISKTWSILTVYQLSLGVIIKNKLKLKLFRLGGRERGLEHYITFETDP